MFVVLAIFVCLTVALALTFYAVCVVCEEYLVPTIDVFIDQFKIPEDVAGVTLVAFGSAAPELFLNLLAAAEGTSDLSLSALLGSSIVAFGLIPPLCILGTDQTQIELTAWPVMREVVFYCIGLVYFLVTIQDGEMTMYEACISVLIYLVYVVFVAVSFFLQPENNPFGSGSKAITDVDKDKGKDQRVILLDQADRSPSNMTTKEGGPITLRGVDKIDTSNYDDERAQMIKPSTPTSNERNGRGDRDADRDKGDHSSGIRKNSDAETTTSSTSLLDSILPSSTTSLGALGAGGTNIDGNDSTQRSFRWTSWDVDDVESVMRVPTGMFQNIFHQAQQHCTTCWGRFKPMAIHFWNQGTSPLGLVIRRIMPSLYPINLVTGAILPNSGGAGNATEGNKVSFLRAMTVLATSISAIAFLAFIIISLAESIIAHIGVGTSTVGATLVALGSEIPDTVSSIALARTRYYDGAMAGAIGSQVINISLGVGLPTLLAIFITGKNIKIDVTESRSLWLLTFLLLLVIIGYIIFALPLGRNFSCALSKYTYIKRPTARGLLLLLLGCTLAFIYLNEEVIEEMPEALAEHEAEEAAAKAAHY